MRDYPPRSYNDVAPPPPSLLLDLIPGAGAAFSVRRIKSDYTGPLIRVRRASDASEIDLGYTSGNELDVTTLLAFVGASSGFVVTWYDQSGNDRHVTQPLTANQPLLVNAGTLNTQNGKPSVLANGTTAYMQNDQPFMYASGASDAHLVIQGASGQSSATHLSENNSLIANTLYDYRPSGTNANTPAQIFRSDANSIYANNTITGTQQYLNGNLNTLTHVDAGNNLAHFVNGVQSVSVGYTRTGVSTLNRFTLFASGRPTVQAFFAGSVSEVVIYGLNNTTTDRQAVEANQKAYFGTP